MDKPNINNYTKSGSMIAPHGTFDFENYSKALDVYIEEISNVNKTDDFNQEQTWEYNLLKKVRWGTDDEQDDVCFYVKKWLSKIAEQEGYTLQLNVE